MKNTTRKIIISVLAILVVAAGYSRNTKVYNMDPEMWKAIGGDPSGSSWESYKGEAQDKINALDLDGDGWIDPAEVAAVNNGTAANYKKNQSNQVTASTPSSTATSSGNNKTGKNKKENKPKNKVTATFKNMYGVIIGTSQITKGTDIAKSQFPKSVPDIETSKGTYVFDHWDYDGEKLTDNVSVKAIYKLKR